MNESKNKTIQECFQTVLPIKDISISNENILIYEIIRLVELSTLKYMKAISEEDILIIINDNESQILSTLKELVEDQILSEENNFYKFTDEFQKHILADEKRVKGEYLK